MFNFSNTTVVPPVDDDESKGGFGTGLNLLVVIIYGALTILLVAIFVQRALLRIVPKFSKGHTDVGKFAPKSLKADIDNRLQRTMHVAFEPILLPEGDERLKWQESDDISTAEEQYNYLYRMKTVDGIKKLEDALCRADSSLKRHPFKALSQHLRDVKSHSSGVMRMVRTSQMKALTDSYEHARFRAENFGKREYEKFSEILSDILSGIENKTKKKKSRKQHSQKNSNNSHTEGDAVVRSAEQVDDTQAISENEPLINEKERKDR